MADRDNRDDRNRTNDEQNRQRESDEFVTDAEMEVREANGGRPSDSGAERKEGTDRNPSSGRE